MKEFVERVSGEVLSARKKTAGRKLPTAGKDSEECQKTTSSQPSLQPSLQPSSQLSLPQFVPPKKC